MHDNEGLAVHPIRKNKEENATNMQSGPLCGSFGMHFRPDDQSLIPATFHPTSLNGIPEDLEQSARLHGAISGVSESNIIVTHA